jgi:hypothetical protein
MLFYILLKRNAATKFLMVCCLRKFQDPTLRAADVARISNVGTTVLISGN